LSDIDEMELYGAIAADLARGRDRAEALAAHGLDEAAFEQLEDRAYAAMSVEDEQRGVPEPVARFDAALRAAAERHAGDAPSLEDFVRALQIVQEGGKVHERLDERGLSISLLLRGNAHWTPRLATDATLAARFKELCARGVRRGKQ
jgi:hypothetical protein